MMANFFNGIMLLAYGRMVSYFSRSIFIQGTCSACKSLKMYVPLGKEMHQKNIQCLLVRKVNKDLSKVLIEFKIPLSFI